MSRLKQRSVVLPWEQRTAWLTHLFVEQRWKTVLWFALVFLMLTLMWRTLEHRTRMRETRAAIEQARDSVREFRIRVGRCPMSWSEIVHPPKSLQRPLRAVPTDGWGRMLWMRCPSLEDAYDVDVISAGPGGSWFDIHQIR